MKIFQRIKTFLAKGFGVSFLRAISRYFEGRDLPIVTDEALLETFEHSSLIRRTMGKIAQRAGTIQLELYKVGFGEAKEIEQHDLLSLLSKPNPQMSGTDMFELLAIYEKILGNAYLYKVKDAIGKVIQLWVLRSDWVEPKLADDGTLLGYDYKPRNRSVFFQKDEIIHFWSANPLSHYVGTGYLRGLITTVMSDIYAQRWNAKFFLNSARPDGILTTEANLDENDRKETLDEWNKKFGGVGSEHKVAVLSGGLQYETIANTHKDMDFSELRRANIDDVISCLGVPRSILGITEEVTRANAETGVYVFLSETIEPIFRKWTEKLNHSLVPDFDTSIVLDFEDPTPEDEESLDIHHEKALNKWMTVNEIRFERGLEAVEGGDVIYSTFGAVPLGTEISYSDNAQDDEDTSSSGGDSSDKSKARVGAAANMIQLSAPVAKTKKQKKLNRIYKTALRNNKMLRLREELIEDVSSKVKIAVRRTIQSQYKKRTFSKEERAMVWKIFDARLSKWELYWESFQAVLFEKQRKRMRKQLIESGIGEKAIIKAGELDFIDWEKENEIFEKKSKPVIEDIVKETGEYGMNQVGRYNFDPTDKKTAKWILKKATRFAQDVNATTKKRLKASLAEGLLKGESIPDLAKRVDEVMGNRIASSAKTIARTETLSASNAGTLFGYEQTGIVQKKEWLATLDDKVRDAHAEADGIVVGVNDNFSVGGDTLDFPGDPSGSPENIINCRCTILPVISE